MPVLEDQLREELKRVAETVQPGQLRPLRAPAPGQIWRPWLLPAAAAGVVAVIGIVAALLASTLSGQQGVVTPGPGPAAMPRYYVTVGGTPTALKAVVRESGNGHVTGTVAVPDNNIADDWSVTGAADGRTFVIAVDVGLSHLAGTANLRFFRLAVSTDGRPGRPTELPVPPEGVPMTGMALSPDGTMLALSMEHGYPAGQQFPAPYGSIEVINLVTLATRTWTGSSASGYWPGAPTWGSGDRTLTFTWWQVTSLTTGAAVIAGVRELDTSAPGGNLLASRLIPFQTPIQDLQSAVITPDGRDIIASSCGDVSASGGYYGTATAKIIELSAADGQIVRVLRTQTTTFANGADEQDALTSTCAVLSVDPSGEHLLVQAFSFGRIDNGVFTDLPGASPGVLFVAAAW